MPHSITDLENLINSVIDKQLNCDDLPFICSTVSSDEGRTRIVELVKKKILNEGITTVDAALALIEEAMEAPDND
jgi:hypothetical protein